MAKEGGKMKAFRKPNTVITKISQSLSEDFTPNREYRKGGIKKHSSII